MAVVFEMACVCFVMHDRYVIVCRLGEDVVKKKQEDEEKDCNKKEIKRPRDTTRGDKLFECHGHGMQVSKSVCVCARACMHACTYIF
jgi:hypothetical protein